MQIARKGKNLKRVEKYLKTNKLIQILAAAFTMVVAVTVVPQSVLPARAEPGANSPYNESNPSYHYFYNQLNTESKRIYEAMEEMYENGIFARGEDYDLSEHGKVTAAQLQTFVNGSSKLLDDYGAARDAFQYDYPDVFYVDFSLLSVRVLKKSNGELHGYLGAGRSDTYLLRTFIAKTEETEGNIPDAVAKYEKKISEILKGLPTTAAEGETLDETKTRYIHDYLTKEMVYHYENEVLNKACNSRTAYDALIYGEGVCEAYTRGFKALMDRAGIPTVCVYGVYKVSETRSEQHIWNHVKIGDCWYAVDVTQDDPINMAKPNEKISGKETDKLCLVGQFEMMDHKVSGIMSSAMFEFEYPGISYDAIGEVSMYYDEDLIVKLKGDTWGEGGDEIESGTFCVSYRGKNYTQNTKDGYYILSRYGQYLPGNDTWNYSGWSYITPELYDSNLGGHGMEPEEADSSMVPDGKAGQDGYGEGNFLYLPMPHVMMAQFAVTTIPPSFEYSVDNGITGSLYYEGDLNLLTVVSPEMENKWGTYVAPPYPSVNTTPAMNSIMHIGHTYHVKTTYNEKLKLAEGYDMSTLSIAVSQTSSATDVTLSGVDNSKVKNLKWDGDSTIEFDFTPSKMYADNNSYYDLQIVGLIGDGSDKKPVPITYACAYASSYCSLGICGFNWKVFGQPQLLEGTDIDVSGWKAVDIDTGESVGIPEGITGRMVLVAESMTSASKRELEGLLGDEEPEMKVLSSAFYNIQLAICKAMIIETGESVRVGIGYPAGYSYKDIGDVVFKAYHYVVDKTTGKPTGIEPITCVATEYGLIIECKSFSPFVVLAADADTVDEEPVVTAVLQSDENGAFYDDKGVKLEGAKGMVVLDESMTGKNAKKVTVKANKGYVINAVTINNRRIQLDEDNAITLDYNTYKNQTVIVSAEFISATVHEQDIENGLSNDIVPDYPDDSTDASSRKSGNASSQTASGSGSNGSSAQTSSGTGSDDSSAQTSSGSGSNDSSVQTASGSDNNDNSTASGSVTGDNEVKTPSREPAKGGQEIASPSNKTTDSSSGSDSSTSNEAATEPQPGGTDYANASDAASSTDIVSIYGVEDEYVETGEDGIDEDNVLTFIVILVAIAGIAAVGFAVYILRIKVER